MSAGKAFSGATAINYGLWLRRSSADYDRWSMIVGDDNWSYRGFLPYFKGFERHFDPEGDREQHGFDEPMQTTSVFFSDPTPKYPLRSKVQQVCKEMGFDMIKDYNCGDPLGLGEVVENWRDGKRQPAHEVSDLSRVKILCGTTVHCVFI